jgi:hypothetical protein
MPQRPDIAVSVSASYLELTKAAEILNNTTDAFGEAVSQIDEALKKLNLGITVWVIVDEEPRLPGDLTYRVEEIGYSKVGGKWGIALRTRTGDETFGDDEREAVEAWLFNEASRTLRMKAIEKLPELVGTLSLEAAKMTKQLQSKLADAQAVAAALNPPFPKSFAVKVHNPNHPLQPVAISDETKRQFAAASKKIDQHAAASAVLAGMTLADAAGESLVARPNPEVKK